MSGLTFEEFYRAVHGVEPFPWQVRAAHRLARREVFNVTVPTGLGKSAMVDAAIWAAGQGAWRRIAFVVDRRIVVDAVHQRALKVQECLSRSSERRVQVFAQLLGNLQVVRLRGGVFGDDDWVLYPDRVSVLLTTVDQLGSRLLFRGYGVSPRRWPMHAGFVSDDMLVVIDEAHLSMPFVQTLAACHRLGADVSLVPMSATLPTAEAKDQLALEADDLALDTVRQRLDARKLIELVECGPGETEFVKAASDTAVEMVQRPGVRRVAIVVNRVASARRCHDRLRAAGQNSVLLTGRVRQAERDAQLVDLLPQVEAGRPRSVADQALIVVATQTIEVGADFDFDALVSESAPMSSLRQRFGRLDRLGVRGVSNGAILYRPAKSRDDPVYGHSLADTWDWLCERAAASLGTVDFGLRALRSLLDVHPAPPEAIRFAASLLPTHLQLLAQTGPFVPTFDLGPWLHGPTDRAPDVTLVWRDDLDADDPSGWMQAAVLLPPMSREAMSMPSAAVRRWLTRGKGVEQWGDEGPSVDDDGTGELEDRPVLRWRGPDDCRVIRADEIRPGDTLILPASYGGCDAWGWAPDSTATVDDLADRCMLERVEAGGSQRVVLRLTRGHWQALGRSAPALEAQVRQLLALEARVAADDEELDDELADARSALLSLVLDCGHPLARALHSPRIDSHSGGLVIRGTGTEEVEGVLETGVAVPLNVHHADVARWGARLAQDRVRQADIVEAARIHDAGKTEPRMQSLLHGNALRAAGGPLLAKSALRRRDEQVAAWLGSGLPRGFRHEFASLEVESITDDLIRHLVATHHGYGRPWLINCADRDALGARYARLDAHWAQHWAGMVVLHGAWPLAGLEWLLRAADARASIEEAASVAEV